MSSQTTIRFLLGEKLTEIDFSAESRFKPYTTLLEYLRMLNGRHGTKEGCGIGDCGACTVVIACPEEGHLVYKTINSCLVFLPMIDGKQILTVEDLSDRTHEPATLHPVQEALTDTFGSQCGYCTPGIVMSMFGLYKNHQYIDRDLAGEWFSGNLCRCTGYQSILHAVERISGISREDKFSRNENQTINTLNTIRNRKKSFEFSEGNSGYFRPAALLDALDLKKRFPTAELLNGATETGLKRESFIRGTYTLIDLSGIEELNFIRSGNTEYIFGSGVNLQALRSFLSDKIPEFSLMAGLFGSIQIRNLATLAGNIAAASPVSDSLPMLVCLGASIVVESTHGARKIPVEDFITAYRKTCLLPDELITAVIIPVPDAQTKLFYHKHSARNDVDIATVNGAFSMKQDHSETITEIKLCFGAMAPTVKRAEKTENFLLGKIPDKSNIEKASLILDEDFKPISDVRAGAEARRIIAGNMLIKFFSEHMHHER